MGKDLVGSPAPTVPALDKTAAPRTVGNNSAGWGDFSRWGDLSEGAGFVLPKNARRARRARPTRSVQPPKAESRPSPPDPKHPSRCGERTKKNGRSARGGPAVYPEKTDAYSVMNPISAAEAKSCLSCDDTAVKRA